jgi:hypothetical protein
MPPSTKVVTHEKLSRRGSWDPHGKLRWYLGPVLEHYHCHKCHVTTTNSERISDTVEFFPHADPIKKISPQEATVIAAEALTEALQREKPPNNLAMLLESVKLALNQLQQYIQPPATVEATSERPLRVREPPRVRPDASDKPTADSIYEAVAKRTRSSSSPMTTPNFYASAVSHPITSRAMEYRQLITDPATRDEWQLLAANKFGRLVQGVRGRVKGTKTITFIPHHEMPNDRQATYLRFVCSEQPQKQEKISPT